MPSGCARFGVAMYSHLSVQNQISSRDAEKSLTILVSRRKPKIHVYGQFSGINESLRRACEELDWNHERSTPHRSDTHGIAEGAARRVKEGTSSVLVQSGLQENWWAETMECHCYLRNVQDHWQMARDLVNVGSIHHLKGRIFHLEQK